MKIFIWIVASILFIAASNMSMAICPTNEEPAQCADFCNTCVYNSSCMTSQCISGCDCISGYKRKPCGTCVPEDICEELQMNSRNGDDLEAKDRRTCILENSIRCSQCHGCSQKCKEYGFSGGVCAGKNLCRCFTNRCTEFSCTSEFASENISLCCSIGHPSLDAEG